MPKNNQGFTLPEMLISLSLGLLLILLLTKLYLWQADLQHDMEDMIFLDRHGFLVMQLLGDALRSAKQVSFKQEKGLFKIEVVQDKNTTTYWAADNQFWKKQENDNALALVSGIQGLTANNINSKAIKVMCQFVAPHKMTAQFQETMTLENKFS